MGKPTHVCARCGHKWQSLDNDTARKVIAAAKVNKQGPFCHLCFHLEWAAIYAKARGYRSLQEALEAFDAVRMVRVNGDVVCGHCGKLFRNHPLFTGHLIDDGTGRQVPWLREGCDGRLLKL